MSQVELSWLTLLVQSIQQHVKVLMKQVASLQTGQMPQNQPSVEHYSAIQHQNPHKMDNSVDSSEAKIGSNLRRSGGRWNIRSEVVGWHLSS